MAEGALKERTAKGLFWGGLSNGLLQVISLVFAVIIGRILDPRSRTADSPALC